MKKPINIGNKLKIKRPLLSQQFKITKKIT
jgi:hypothetical protein